MIGQSNDEAQASDKTNAVDEGISSNNMTGPIQVNSPQVYMHTLEENIVSKVRSKLDNVMTTVETRVQDAVLTAIENSVSPRVVLAMKSASASSGRNVEGNVLEPDERDFSGNIEGLQRIASHRLNSRTDLNRIDETRGNITVEESDLLVNERNIDRQTHFITRAEEFKIDEKVGIAMLWNCSRLNL